jgi:hypothetical protein
MSKVPLTGAAYTSRSLIASAQRSVNLYSEHNPQDSPFPATYYQTPGLVTLATASNTSWRALYTSTLGVLYGVCNNTLYSISSTFTLTAIGVIDSIAGPVSMVDNGLNLLIVDGSSSGWTLDLFTGVFAKVPSTEAFYGADRVDLVDGFFILNRPDTNQWYISGFLTITFDGLDFAGKTGFSDKVVAVGAAKRQVFVFGEQTTEVWYNTGANEFTFARMPGAFIQFGCMSAATVQQMDGSLFWLSRSPQGECMVMQTQNYDRARISTFAIEKEFQSYARVDDATAYTYQQDGHSFYILNFPTANKTWGYDLSTSEWHERTWMDTNGVENRQRANCHALFNGNNIVGDWQSGKLYRLDQTVYTDDGAPIHRIRSFPHLIDDGNRVMYRTLLADMEVGNGVASSIEAPELRLRWSDTKGLSYGNYISQDIGATGEFLACVQFQRLGMARDRVFELSWAANAKTALSGAYIDAQPAGS